MNPENSYCMINNLFVGNFCFLNIYSPDVRDVCMDEAAVSSDPVVAFLLDEVVVKDWCKRAFKNILSELQQICILINLVNILIQCL